MTDGPRSPAAIAPLLPWPLMGKAGIIGFKYGSRRKPGYTEIQKPPRLIPKLKGITQLAAGSNHISVIPTKSRRAGAFHVTRRRAKGPKHYKVVNIARGQHHSLAVTAEGQLLTWSRIDHWQTGFPSHSFTEKNAIFDRGMPIVASVAAGTGHSLALTAKGEDYS
ncbi:hypothetical protein F4820DRAFT_453368 [Hypoxylon rubiginosum]|uniref:Uncharacterized protein n=1 Tax=Hypoxylon rubiginosum TaxID=110542 RepID=A0ACB9YL94_9PEZI|nr:hypothetical protein F4820DRAFT_453368 [Hypoxylon rubiginosum]